LGRTLRLEIPAAFAPLLNPARYKGAHGGRGSGKSHFFAERVIEDSLYHRGLRTVCIREVQKTLAQSSKLLIEDKISALGVAGEFRIFEDRIQTPGGGLVIFQGMQNHTAESIKSLEGFHRAWLEEAQSISSHSLTLLRPTIRAKDSELWASWNPRRKTDAIDEFFRGEAAKRDKDVLCVEANWRDNPWFPPELEKERQRDHERYPDRYSHIWEGDYARALEGAYFSRDLATAKAQGRITRVGPDYMLPIRAFFDLGGAGAAADAMAIWIAQFVGREIRVLDYIEGVGQPLPYYVSELRRRGWGTAIIVLPHDGVNTDAVIGKRYADHWKDAGFSVPEPIKNQGKGAAMMRIEAVRRHFPIIWFNAATTEAGRDALGYYHEKKDEARGVGLGPEHDWSSHGSDAFGLMCVAYEQFEKIRDRNVPPPIPAFSNPIASTGMLG
jgi:phage terminase large subunit